MLDLRTSVFVIIMFLCLVRLDSVEPLCLLQLSLGLTEARKNPLSSRETFEIFE